MKKFVLLLILILNGQYYDAQLNNEFKHHSISIDFGSIRNRYIYPISNIRYQTPLIRNKFRFSSRLRSYGTLYLFTKDAYDMTSSAEYFICNNSNGFIFSAGLGLDWRIRLVNDIRSSASTSVEPLFLLNFQYSNSKSLMKIPIWNRFYTNGFSFTILPEYSFQLTSRMAIFTRYECGYLKHYSFSNSEWRQDLFIGLNVSL
jgi:hypothetical protein